MTCHTNCGANRAYHRNTEPSTVVFLLRDNGLMFYNQSEGAIFMRNSIRGLPMSCRVAIRVLGLILIGLIFVGCGAPVPAATAEATESPAETTEFPDAGATPSTRSLLPQTVTIKSGDGTDIAALYWPPVTTPAPAVVLMHMMGGSKNDWGQFATLLQGAGIARVGADAPAPLSFAVLAIDFRGHGESGGASSDTNGMLADAQTAREYLRSLSDVDPDQIIMIGASIGADAAVDQCTDGCVGAVSLSPGSFLGVPYNDALKQIGDRPVLCIATEGDTPSANTCTQGETVGLSDFQVQLYTGSAHGTTMFEIADQTPHLIDLIFAWLRGHFTPA
jgi:dienelactone hydrolase